MVLAAVANALRAVISLATAIAVVVGAAISLGVHRAAGDLAGTVFGGNAVLVALIVPAAALANTLVEGRLVSYTNQLPRLERLSGAAKTTAARKLSNRAGEVVGVIEPLLQGFMLLLISFGLSIGALFHPNHHIWSGHGWWKVNLEDLLLGGALGFDVVGICLLLPFVWLLLDKQLASQTKDVITRYADRAAVSGTTSAASAPSTPAAATTASASAEEQAAATTHVRWLDWAIAAALIAIALLSRRQGEQARVTHHARWSFRAR